jgi:hypothetical protein
MPHGVKHFLYSSSIAMKRYLVSITPEMEAALERERQRRLLDSIPETVRVILSEYFSKS